MLINIFMIKKETAPFEDRHLSRIFKKQVSWGEKHHAHFIWSKRINELNRKEAAEKAATNSIRKMIKNLKLTAEAAMEALEIPKSDYPKYMAMLWAMSQKSKEYLRAIYQP